MDKNKWGGNFNCIMCAKHIQNQYGHRICSLYNVRLRKGNVPGLWILPCSSCHKNKTYGGNNE